MKCPFNRQKYDIKSWHISIQTQCKCQHHIKNSIKFDRIICSNPLYRCFLISKSDELLAKISNKVIHFCGDQSERSVCISRTKYCLTIDKFQIWHCIVWKFHESRFSTIAPTCNVSSYNIISPKTDLISHQLIFNHYQ